MPMTITDVLGTVREVTHYYGDGSYDCPHCFYAVRADEEFDLTKHNPWCIANPLMSVESAQKIVADREAKQRKEAARRRNHELAMERIAEYNTARNEARTRMMEEARDSGYCLVCMYKTDGRVRVKHRKTCPHKR